MNRYLLIDFETNTLYNIEKVDINFEENEIQTSSVSCIDKDDLIQELKEQIGELEKRNIKNEKETIYKDYEKAFDNLKKQMKVVKLLPTWVGITFEELYSAAKKGKHYTNKIDLEIDLEIAMSEGLVGCVNIDGVNKFYAIK